MYKWHHLYYCSSTKFEKKKNFNIGLFFLSIQQYIHTLQEHLMHWQRLLCPLFALTSLINGLPRQNLIIKRNRRCNGLYIIDRQVKLWYDYELRSMLWPTYNVYQCVGETAWKSAAVSAVNLCHMILFITCLLSRFATLSFALFFCFICLIMLPFVITLNVMRQAEEY